MRGKTLDRIRKPRIKEVAMLLLLLSVGVWVGAQSQQHPIIWVTKGEKAGVLEKIEKYEWARSIKQQMHNLVDPVLKACQSNQSDYLSKIPKIQENGKVFEDHQALSIGLAHNQELSIASKSAMLYYLTDEEKYARFTADILWVYIKQIASRTPETTTICGNEFFDPRLNYDHFALAYDFAYPYLTSGNATVYDNELRKRISFDNLLAQRAILNMVGNTLQEYSKPDKYGKKISNHPVLTAPGVLYGIFCVDNDVERERLFKVFWETGTFHQNSFTKTILPMFGKQGIWPESTSYSFMPLNTLVLNIVDRVYPELQVTQAYKHILEGNFLFDNLRMPNRDFVRYGDSKRSKDKTIELYRYTLDVADRNGYQELKQQAIVALNQAYNALGGNKPKISIRGFNNYEDLQLFWGKPIPANANNKIDFQKPTVVVEHAGIALQRNTVPEKNEIYGLCGIIGGAHYVHSHVTGISMELYGAGYVMAPNAGLSIRLKDRKSPVHSDYYRLYAGNNTVIVNGTSHGRQKGSWTRKSYLWQNSAVNIAAEPKHLEQPICKNFNFATQYLNDRVNKCKQERTLGILRTSDTTAYYFDMFRSRSLVENKFHDYIYHNIGDTQTVLDAKSGNELPLSETDRYKNDIGDEVQSPGWRYFENTKVTVPLKTAVNIAYHIQARNRFMRMYVPAGIEREYTKAVGPETREASGKYSTKKTNILAIRQQGEAWNKPFMAIFEPTVSKQSIKKVESLWDGEKVVGATVTSHLGNKIVKDYIICQDSSNAIFRNKQLKISFKGRYAVVRTIKEKKKTKIELYIGEGEKLVFRKNELLANEKKIGYRLVK